MSDTTYETETRSRDPNQKPKNKTNTYKNLLNPEFAGYEQTQKFTLKILTSIKNYKETAKILTSFKFIEKILQNINTNLASKNPKKLKIAKNFLKILNQIFKNFNLKFFRLSTFEMVFAYLTSICMVSRHGLYYSLKILVTCIKKNWKLDWIIKEILLLRLNDNLRKLKFEKDKGLKNCLKMMKKLFFLMRNENKKMLVHGVINFCGDLEPKRNAFYKIFEPVVMENPKIFEREILSVLSVLMPEQLSLASQGPKIVKMLIPEEEEEKIKFYLETKFGEFVMKILACGKINLDVLQYLLIYISDFEPIWSQQKFHKNFIVDLCESFYRHSNYLALSNQVTGKFEDFLNFQKISENPNFFKKMKILKNPDYLIKIMIYNSLMENGSILKKSKQKIRSKKLLKKSLENFTNSWSNQNKDSLITSKLNADIDNHIGGFIAFKTKKLENLELTLNRRTNKILKKSHTKLLTPKSHFPPQFTELQLRIVKILEKNFLVSLKKGPGNNSLNIRNMKTGRIIFSKSFPNFKNISILEKKIFYWSEFSVSIIEFFVTKEKDIIPKVVFFKNFVGFLIKKILPFDNGSIAIFPKLRSCVYLFEFKKGDFVLCEMNSEQLGFLEEKLNAIEEEAG